MSNEKEIVEFDIAFSHIVKHGERMPDTQSRISFQSRAVGNSDGNVNRWQIRVNNHDFTAYRIETNTNVFTRLITSDKTADVWTEHKSSFNSRGGVPNGYKRFWKAIKSKKWIKVIGT